ncbi:uncharacterized protein LACBIDRAFT_307409 [Laccaria bicolor S238N-H82]|uniref:Predicted protein n=1 Tax=Laccaria bicolor (strain S238N-H82 / ATCC MYA-4686) TaxID=486041 RepID=B0DQ28_LACBS|nr:uncharacterized protein LACBIDRAFT_307409 [Laccaria bicolor S238N-H82]EDR03316.1 predicted protein [Laccaria bicolor S238N-H82]|eukprot:XP_001886112.1 predicted protein [Laccaria bicolor S238N-H82]
MSLRNSLGSHGNTTQLKNMLKNKIMELVCQDVLIVQQFKFLLINVFGIHNSFIILGVSTIMEVPLPRSNIGPCLK